VGSQPPIKARVLFVAASQALLTVASVQL